MKRILFSVTLLMGMSFISCGSSESKDSVYICVTGHVYHATKSCRGLRKATHEINAVSIDEAINDYGRRACKVCN